VVSLFRRKRRPVRVGVSTPPGRPRYLPGDFAFGRGYDPAVAEARIRREQGAAREIAERYVCRHVDDKTGVHEGWHELLHDLIWAGAPRSLQDKATKRVRDIERDAIACFIQSQWQDGWAPVLPEEESHVRE